MDGKICQCVHKLFLLYLLIIRVLNLGFIAPLVTVFLLTYFGVSSKNITEFFRKNMSRVKLALAFFFVGLALVTVLT